MREFLPFLSAIVLAFSATVRAEGPAPTNPVDVGAGTAVEVRLVTIDAVVLDGDQRTVPDLVKGDFVLSVDGKPTEIEVFDVDCPIGAADDPVGVRSKKARPPVAVGGEARRLVLVVDFYHVHGLELAYVFDKLNDLLEHRLAGDEELMLAALANGVRIEQTFTRDRDTLRRSLRRMEYDTSLFAGNFDHTTESPVFSGLEILYQVLSEVPGPKAVVLFSDGNWPSEQDHDRDFAHLAALAGNARATVYPVIASGLEMPKPT